MWVDQEQDMEWRITVSIRNCLVVPPTNSGATVKSILHVRENASKTAKEIPWDKTVDKIEALFREAVAMAA